jgi:hypothetical protein
MSMKNTKKTYPRPEQGTLWYFPAAPTDMQVLQPSGKHMSSDEFETLLWRGKLHLQKEASLASDEPAIYVKAPASIRELKAWLTEATATVEHLSNIEIPKMFEQAQNPKPELNTLEHEFDRQKTLLKTLQVRVKREISELQAKKSRDLSYNQKLIDLREQKIDLIIIKESFSKTQTILKAANLLQIHQTISDSWSYDTLREHVNALINARNKIKKSYGEVCLFVEVLAEAIKDSKWILAEKDKQVQTSSVFHPLPEVAFQHNGRRGRNRKVA